MDTRFCMLDYKHFYYRPPGAFGKPIIQPYSEYLKCDLYCTLPHNTEILSLQNVNTQSLPCFTTLY